MTLRARRIILWVTAAIGLYVGAWAAFLPTLFYEGFPGLGRIWVAVDGPFNEHLIRDVGALYLALAAASVTAALTTGAGAARAVGVAWIVFSVPHLLYHLGHLAGFAPLDAVAQLITLSSTIILGVPLVWPERRPAARSDGSAAAAAMREDAR